MACHPGKLWQSRNENKALSDRPKPVCINDRLAVELLNQLLRFVSLSRHRNFEPAKSVILGDTSEIVVSRRLDLRYICLMWHNIVHRSVRLLLDARHLTGLGLYDEFTKVRLTSRRADMVLKSSVLNDSKMERKGVWLNLIDFIQSAAVNCNYYACDPLLSTLIEAIPRFTQPIDLNLDFNVAGLGVACEIVESATDFPNQFPEITLRHLNLGICTYPDNDFAVCFENNMTRCTNYVLDVGKQTLESLGIALTALDTVPEDWVCDSLRKLSLGLCPFTFDRREPFNEDKVSHGIAKQSRIPRIFPQLETISLSTEDWPHIDFTVLGRMERLKKLEITCISPNAQIAWQLCSLPNIQSLYMNCWVDPLPMHLSEFVPNLKQLELDIRHKNACKGLVGEMNADFPQLSDISLNFLSFFFDREVPPPADVVALFAILRQLPALKSLSLKLCRGVNADWCRPGDFSLLQGLSRSLKTCSLSYCLLPAPRIGSSDEVKFVFDPNVPDAEAAIYKIWFQNAVLRLCELSSLERFFCRISAPSFHAAVSLAAKWSKSSSAAIADLGLANVINVSCSTDAYLSIEPGQRYSSCDTLTFRFTLAARPALVNRKFSTPVFVFELEYPHAADFVRG